MNWNPTDRFSAWANYDYFWFHDNDNDLTDNYIHTVALASRYGITDATGIALRGEYQWWGDIDQGGPAPQLQFWAITGTVDHTLTENLTVKVEARYDVGKVRNDPDDFFLDGGDGPNAWDDNDQVLGLRPDEVRVLEPPAGSGSFSKGRGAGHDGTAPLPFSGCHPCPACEQALLLS